MSTTGCNRLSSHGHPGTLNGHVHFMLVGYTLTWTMDMAQHKGEDSPARRTNISLLLPLAVGLAALSDSVRTLVESMDHCISCRVRCPIASSLLKWTRQDSLSCYSPQYSKESMEGIFRGICYSLAHGPGFIMK